MSVSFNQSKLEIDMNNGSDIIYLFIYLVIAMYFLGAYVASSIASKKGQSGCLFFILSMFVSPIFTIILALLLRDNRYDRTWFTNVHRFF